MPATRKATMTGVPSHSVVSVGVCALLLAGCSGGTGQDLPEIPAVSGEDFSPSARVDAERRIRTVAESPRDPWANGDLATMLHAHSQTVKAAALYRRAEALSGGEFQWTYLLGVAQQNNGSSREAAESFRRALAKRPYVPAAVRLGETLADDQRLEEARDALRGAQDSGPNEAAAAYGLGRVLLDLGDTGEAVSFLERAVALAPDSGAARYALASALRVAGDQDTADRILRTVGAANNAKPALDDPLLARVRELAADEHHFLNLGKSLEAEGKVADAVAAYERALAINPRMASAHANLVGAYGRLGNAFKAEAHYKAALSIDPDIEELHNNWGVLQASKRDAEAAASAFRQALEVNPQSAKAHANLGVALTELGQAVEAARHFRQAVASDPTNRSARMHLGTMALAADRPAEAARHLEAALAGQDDGSEPFIRYTLAHAYFGTGRTGDANRSIAEALRLAEESGLVELANRIRQEIESSSR